MLTFPRLFVAIVMIVIQVVPALSRSRADLVLENLALRQQLTTLKRKRSRPCLDDTDRGFWGYCQVVLRGHEWGVSPTLSANASHLLKNVKRSLSQKTVVLGTDFLSTDPKQIPDDTVNREKALCMSS